MCIWSYFTIIVLFQRSAGHHRIVWDSEKSNWAFHPDSPLQILLSSLAWNYRLIIFRRFLFWPSKYLPCKSTWYVLVLCDQSIGSTEPKYIKPNTKTQNNIVVSWIFHKKWFCYFGFFEIKLTEIQVFTKKISWFVFCFFSISFIQWIDHL